MGVITHTCQKQFQHKITSNFIFDNFSVNQITRIKYQQKQKQTPPPKKPRKENRNMKISTYNKTITSSQMKGHYSATISCQFIKVCIDYFLIFLMGSFQFCFFCDFMIKQPMQNGIEATRHRLPTQICHYKSNEHNRIPCVYILRYTYTNFHINPGPGSIK